MPLMFFAEALEAFRTVFHNLLNLKSQALSDGATCAKDDVVTAAKKPEVE